MSKSRLTLYQAYRMGISLLEKTKYHEASIDAKVLLCHALQISSEYFYAHSGDVTLSEVQLEDYMNLLRLRLAKVPVAYITGHKEFMGLDFDVDKSVLIPRPATETLVELALEWLGRRNFKNPQIIDIGCGSGNISLSLLYYHTGARVIAVDISEDALDTARENYEKFKKLYPEKKMEKRIEFIKSDLFDEVPDYWKGEIALVVSNPPYVTESEFGRLMDGVKLYEPRCALVPPAGADRVYKEIAFGAKGFLAPTGALMVETGAKQGIKVKKIFEEAGYGNTCIFKDLEGHDRIVAGEKPGTHLHYDNTIY